MHLVTDHVKLRRACPAPLGVDCIARRARLHTIQPHSSAAHPVQSMLLLLPMGTLHHGMAKHHVVGKVKGAYQPILARGHETGNASGPFIPTPQGGAFWP
jgi:hypothetical protein